MLFISLLTKIVIVVQITTDFLQYSEVRAYRCEKHGACMPVDVTRSRGKNSRSIPTCTILACGL